MEKNRLKYIIDSVMFVALASTVAVGLLLAFAIPRGQGRAGNMLLGVDRHAWGDFHFYLALIFLAALVLHILMNRAWIAQLTRRFFRERSRVALWAMGGAWVFVLFAGWLILRIGA